MFDVPGDRGAYLKRFLLFVESLFKKNQFPAIINMAVKNTNAVMPDSIRHPVFIWIPAFARMTRNGVFSCRRNNTENQMSSGWHFGTIGYKITLILMLNQGLP
jgi:uncharacterized membrane protein